MHVTAESPPTIRGPHGSQLSLWPVGPPQESPAAAEARRRVFVGGVHVAVARVALAEGERSLRPPHLARLRRHSEAPHGPVGVEALGAQQDFRRSAQQRPVAELRGAAEPRLLLGARDGLPWCGALNRKRTGSGRFRVFFILSC